MTSEIPWPRSADGRVRLNVLKHFSFIHMDGMTSQVHQRKFEPGELVLDPEKPEDAVMLAHPWICEQFADGHIESPDQTRARLKAEEARHAEVRERQQALLREAEMLSGRMRAAMESQARAQGQAGDDLQSELDTPLNQPRRRGTQATGLDTPLNAAARFREEPAA
jgi:hypothetical protein